MKSGIITIIDNNNIGNRLQNYALQEFLAKYGEVDTIKNIAQLNGKDKILLKFLKMKLKGNRYLLE